jgi:membrane-associated protein
VFSLDPATFIRTAGYAGLFILVFAESGLLIGAILPGGDTLLLTAGLLASQGVLDIRVLIPLCFIAALTGYDAGYLFGRYAGRRLIERGDSGWFRREYLLRAEAFFAQHGGKAIVLARFVPVVRTFTPIAAGMVTLRYSRFAVLNVLGALLWTAGVTSAGYFLGDRILAVARAIFNPGRHLPPIVGVAIIACMILAASYLWRRNQLRART